MQIEELERQRDQSMSAMFAEGVKARNIFIFIVGSFIVQSIVVVLVIFS